MADAKTLPKKITSLAVLREALELNHACKISERKLAAALSDDRSPQKQAEAGYEVERIHAWLVAQEVVADPTATDDEAPQASGTGPEVLPPAPDDTTLAIRHKPGTVLCTWCAIPVNVQTTAGMFQHFEKCTKCGHRPPKRVKPQARDMIKEQKALQQARQPAVERP